MSRLVIFYVVWCIIIALIPLVCVFMAQNAMKNNNSGIATCMCACEGVVSGCQGFNILQTVINSFSMLAWSGFDKADCSRPEGPFGDSSYFSPGKFGQNHTVAFARRLQVPLTVANNTAGAYNPFGASNIASSGNAQSDVEACEKFVDWIDGMLPLLKAIIVIGMLIQCCGMLACVFGTMQSHKAKSALDRGLLFTAGAGRKRGLKTKKTAPQPRPVDAPGGIDSYSPLQTTTQPIPQASPASSVPEASFAQPVSPPQQYANIASMPTYQPVQQMPPSPPQLYTSMPAANYAAALPTAAYAQPAQPTVSMPTAAAMPTMHTGVPTQYAGPVSEPTATGAPYGTGQFQGYAAGYPTQTAVPQHQGLY